MIEAEPHTSITGNIDKFRRNNVLLGATLVTLFLGSVSYSHYLLFHVLVELFSVIVGFAIFIVAYNSFVFTRNTFLLFLAQGFFWVACIDMVHTLYYRGMGLAPGNDPNYATQLWLCARYLEAVTLLIAPRYLSLRVFPKVSFVIFGMAAILASVTVILGYFPTAYVEGQGLTTFKVVSEYIIIVLLALAAWRIQQQRHRLAPSLRMLMHAVIGLTIVSEFAFTLYVSVYGISNLVGHFAKLWAFGLLLLAVSRWMLERPFHLLARDAGSFERMPMPVSMLDIDGVIQSYNQSAKKMRPQLEVGVSVHDVWHPQAVNVSECPVCTALRQGKGMQMEMHDAEKNEWAAISLEPVTQKNQLKGFVYVHEDITAKKLAAAAQHASDERLRAILENAADSVFVFEPQGQLIYVNQQAMEIVGHEAADLLKMNMQDLLVEDDSERLQSFFQQIGENEQDIIETCLVRSDADNIPVEVNAVRLPDGNIYAACRDITERKNYEAQLEHQANHDPLTGLANRTLLADRMEQALAYARRSKRLVAVMLLDLDRFKLVNDSMGHDAGDTLLQNIAKRLDDCVRPGDTVARLGGDEFMVVMSDMAHEADAVNMARKLLEAIEQPISVGLREIVVTSSLGVALFPRDGESKAALFKNADVAMYRAKEGGSNIFRFYSPEMNELLLERVDLEARLRRALEHGELMLHYQPQISLQSKQVVGAEALIRWQHPKLGMVPPATFIPVAEEAGLINGIGEWVIDSACAQIKAWEKAGYKDLQVAVNVSARQFQHLNLSMLVKNALERHGVAANKLEMELTETTLMQDPEQAVAILAELKEIGVSIALDDFGTGYSSLNYLRRFPIDRLKIDQSFVHDVLTDQDDASIAKAIIGMAHNLNRTVIAEGVETEGQLTFLQKNACDIIQGFWYARPMPAHEFTAWLASNPTLDSRLVTA